MICTGRLTNLIFTALLFCTLVILYIYIYLEKIFFAEGRIQRQISSDSMSSINSMSSACSFTSQQSAATDGDLAKKKKKKGWVSSQGRTVESHHEKKALHTFL